MPIQELPGWKKLIAALNRVSIDKIRYKYPYSMVMLFCNVLQLLSGSKYKTLYCTIGTVLLSDPVNFRKYVTCLSIGTILNFCSAYGGWDGLGKADLREWSKADSTYAAS